jgi:glutathione S-transferase
MRLYDFEYSGNCWKVRLLLDMLGLGYERVPVDSSRGETQLEAFKAVSLRGQIPLLEDGDVRLWDSQAILYYLARRYGGPDSRGGPWLPPDPVGGAQVMQWLALSENELLYGLARARAALKFGRPFDVAACQAEGRAGLDVLEQRLTGHDWLVGDAATIADLACCTYVALAHESEVSLDGYPAARGWLGRIAALPGYRAMQGL